MVNQSLNNSSTFNNPHLTQASGSSKTATSLQHDLTDEMKEALSSIQGLDGLNIEICGSWIWVFGADSSHQTKLEEADFKWSYKKGAWYLPPSNSKRRVYHRSWAIEKIREKYGSQALRV